MERNKRKISNREVQIDNMVEEDIDSIPTDTDVHLGDRIKDVDKAAKDKLRAKRELLQRLLGH